jgi:hypothetical protein
MFDDDGVILMKRGKLNVNPGTIKERLGYRQEVVDRQLAHAPKDKVTSAYDRAQFLAERRKKMQDWAAYIDAVRGKGAPPQAPRLILVNDEFSREAGT